MIRDLKLVGNGVPRRQLPQGLLAILLSEARVGNRELSIALCDQLAPAHRSNTNLFFYSSIPAAIDAICYHCPPAPINSPVLTMEPDVADHGQHPPLTIFNQWRKQVDESWPWWKGAEFTATSRNSFYGLLPTVDAVVQTLSTEPYANLILRIDPSRSCSLKDIPAEICPTLADHLSRAGHSNSVVIVPTSCAYLVPLQSLASRLEYECTTTELAAAIAKLWQPDTHIQHPDKPLQKSLGIYCSKEFTGEMSDLPFDGDWSNSGFRQHLSEVDFSSETADSRVVTIVIAKDDNIRPGACYIMKNWISGFDGGF